MPRFDQTGPVGSGPRTGRGMGPCGRGYGRGWGFGRFCDRSYLTKDEEIEDMEEEAKNLEADLQALKKMIEEAKGQK